MPGAGRETGESACGPIVSETCLAIRSNQDVTLGALAVNVQVHISSFCLPV